MHNLKKLGIKRRDIEIILTFQKIKNLYGYASQSAVAILLGVTACTIQRHIKKLERLGWLYVDRVGSKRWEYTFTDACPFTYCTENPKNQRPSVQSQPLLSSSIRALGKVSGSPKPTKPDLSKRAISDLSKPNFPNDSAKSDIAKLENLLPQSISILYKNNTNYYSSISTDQYEYEYVYDQTDNDKYKNDQTNIRRSEMCGGVLAYQKQPKQTSVRGQILQLPKEENEKILSEIKGIVTQEVGMKIIARDEAALADLKKRLENLPSRPKTVPRVRRSDSDDFSPDDAEDFWQSKKPAKQYVPSEAAAKCTRMQSLFKKLWIDYRFAGRCASWTDRERKHIKDLIAEQGEEAVSTYIKYCLRNWKDVCHRYRIMSPCPTVPIMYGYRRSLLPEALDPSKKPTFSSAEYTETDIPSGSWG